MFDLNDWLKRQHKDYKLEIPLVDISGKDANDDREWLVSNGLGSFASSNIWGANTRRYHGLFFAALNPPVQRTLLLSRIDEIVDGENISTNRWASGAVSPEGFRKLVAFTIYPVPTWVYEVNKGFLIKQVAMVPGKQEVCVGYTYHGFDSIKLDLHVLCNYRDFHGNTHGAQDWRFIQNQGDKRVAIRAFDSAQEFTVAFTGGSYRQAPEWYWGYGWPQERERGLEDKEDAFHAGVIECTLNAGETVTVCASLAGDVQPRPIAAVVSDVVRHQNELLDRAGNPADENVKRLVIAADAFVVKRNSTKSHSIIAGYHWFNDWGRDSMISLPGTTLSTGRTESARGILSTFGQYLSEGMLPNNFPDSGQKPEYNTSDATFWWAWAMLKYYQATGDADFVRSQLPLMDSVVEWHCKGTRYGLHMDESDGLISGGQRGVQLTWMDAKCGDFVVTPREGKAVEISALWYNFLKILEQLHATTGGDGSQYGRLAQKTHSGFAKFWNAARGCLFDVIAADGTADDSVRPNQVFALSLPYPLLTEEQSKSVLAVVEAELLTPYGLRTLSPSDPAYQARYGGGKPVANQYDRDLTYHQGTVWPWLLGAWVDARLKVHGETETNKQFVRTHLAAIKDHILGAGSVGSVSEIFDGDAPHTPRGCIAQAWSVAELLRVTRQYGV